MLDLDTLSKLRFGMSVVPKIGGQRGAYEENGDVVLGAFYL